MPDRVHQQLSFRVCLAGLWIVLAGSPVCSGQDQSRTVEQDRALDATTSPPGPPVPEHKRILWILPNYKTYPTLKDYKPISEQAKFKIATEDSFDRGTVALAAAFAGEGQLSNSTRSFGQGVAGYARYFGTAYADFVIGDYMTEAIYPVLLHQDPRYFRQGTGSGISRLGHAVGQIFWCRSDSGRMHFNFSEVVGNSTAVAISNAYYPDNRTAGAAMGKLAIQLGVDMAGNVLKEFWPDLSRKLGRKRPPSD
jgi:hypothetical protein